MSLIPGKGGCYTFLFILFSLALSHPARAQRLGVKTNVLYWASTTPNLGLEQRISERYTLSAVFGYNPFNFSNHLNASGIAANPKIRHWLVMPEAKYWFSRAFERHNLGLHALYGKYNAGGLKFPAFMEDGRYKGWASGVGFSYGYQWTLGKRWGLDLSIGAGYIFLSYDKYECGACGDKQGRSHHHYIGPTKASASFIYYIR